MKIVRKLIVSTVIALIAIFPMAGMTEAAGGNDSFTTATNIPVSTGYESSLFDRESRFRHM